MQLFKLTRRAFLRASALVTGGLLAACAPATPTPAPTPVPPTAAPKATAVPPTAAPKATVAPTAVPPTAAPKATVAPTAVPPTAVPKVAYKEAPMLTELVKAGKLPPVEQRLPKEPLVLKPWEKVGKYGGTMRMGYIETNLWGQTCLYTQGLLTYDQSCSYYIVDIAKSFKWSPDLKTLTLELREGHKWSDGAPFTVDDILFWWEDVANNKELTPTPNAFWRPGGVPAEFKKVSPTVVTVTFSRPYPVATDLLGRAWFSTDTQFFLPKHYLSNWHIKYNAKATDLAKEEKLDTWMQIFHSRRDTANRMIIGRPRVWAWVAERITSERAFVVRNAYFHQVDEAGNQLPYIDSIDTILTQNKEVHTLKTVAGEFDFETYYVDLKDMPSFKANEQKGNYRILLPRSLRTSICALMPNQTTNDTVLRDLFRQRDFRVALALGINRKAMNDALYFGLATPFPAIAHPNMSFFKKEWATKYVDLDPARANQLLDGLGLTKKDAQGYRLRPDGQGRINVRLEIGDRTGPKLQICEMITQDWKAIGIEATPKEVEGTLFNQQHLAGDLQIPTWHTDRAALFGRPNPLFFGFDDPGQQRWGPKWAMWFNTDGKSGEEPPAHIKKLKETMDLWRQTAPGTPEFDKLGAEYWGFFADEAPMIGTVGLDPWPMIVKNNLRNVQDKDAWWSSDTNFYAPYYPATWFFES